jgi:hypothetical protein
LGRAGQSVAHRRDIDAERVEEFRGRVGALARQQSEQKVRGVDPAGLGGARFFDGALHDGSRAGGQWPMPASGSGLRRHAEVADIDADRGQCGPVESV